MNRFLPAASHSMGDLACANWFPVDLHVPGRRYAFLELDEAVLQRSAFLDTRIEAKLDLALPVSVAEIPPVLPRAHVGWLFHTSFCGSTLAARALHVPPHVACLREPLVLRRLGDARDADLSVDGLIDATVRLLSRPWRPNGGVVIKPTHAALNVAKDLMVATPGSRAVILTSSLDDFLVSNLKKSPESQAKIPALAERALRASTFVNRLPPSAVQPPDLLAAAALQWAAQRELALDIVQDVGSRRIRLLGMGWLLAEFQDAMASIAEWLDLDLSAGALRAHCGEVLLRNAKAVQSPYGPQQRASEALMVANLYSQPLARAREWAERELLPVMRPEACHDPSPWGQN